MINKKQINLKRRKILTRTTLVITIIVLLFLAVTAVMMFWGSITSKKNKIESMSKSMVVNFQSQIDNTIRNASQSMMTFLLDDTIVEFANKEKPTSRDIAQIAKTVSTKNFPFMDTACVYGLFKPNTDLLISNLGMLHYENIVDRYNFTKADIDVIKHADKYEFVNNVYLLNSEKDNTNRLNLLMCYIVPEDTSKSLYGFISIKVSDVTGSEKIGAKNYFMFNDSLCVYKSSKSAQIKKMNMVYEPSKVVFGLKYAYGQEKEEKYLLILVYLMIFMLLLLVGFFVSLHIAKLLHRPIENILTILSDNSEDDIYDEETYIKERFVQMNEMNDQIKSEVGILKKRIEQDYLREILYGAVSGTEIDEKAKECNLYRFCGNICLAVLYKKDRIGGEQDDDKKITALFTECFKNGEIISLNEEKSVLIVNNTGFENFKSDITKIILAIDKRFNIRCIAAVTYGEIESPKKLNKLFLEAMECVETVGPGTEKLIVSKDDIQNRDETFYYPLEIEKDIIEHIKNGQFERARWMLKTIVDKNLLENNIKGAPMIEFTYAIVCTFKRIFHLMNISEDELFGEGMIIYLELKNLSNSKEIEDKIMEIFDTITEYCEKINDSNDSRVIAEITEYLRENYQREDMSLTLLSNHFNLSFAYISKLLKKYNQMNYREYLNRLRIDKATEILDKNPNIRVFDLAKSVGFGNISSFIRNFKQYKNISLGEYKKLK